MIIPERLKFRGRYDLTVKVPDGATFEDVLKACVNTTPAQLRLRESQEEPETEPPAYRKARERQTAAQKKRMAKRVK